MLVERNQVPVINWARLFTEIYNKSEHQLGWSELEKWMRIELFSLLKSDRDLLVFPMEVPFASHHKGSAKTKGPLFIKWADICVFDKSNKCWHWVEIKVRQSHLETLQSNNTKDVKALNKDIMKLKKFDIAGTSRVWSDPKSYERAKVSWVEKNTKEHAHDIVGSHHHFHGLLLVNHDCEEHKVRFSSIAEKALVEFKKGYNAGLNIEAIHCNIEPNPSTSKHAMYGSLIQVYWPGKGD